MGRRTDALQKLTEGLSRGDPGYIAVAVILAIVIPTILYFRFRKRSL